MAFGAAGIDGRLSPLRGRLAASRAAEDLQAGLAAGAAAALLLALLRWLDLVAVPPSAAAAVGASVALLVPAAGVLLRRTSSHRVAVLVDERLGLAERTATALALESGAAAPTPLGPLVTEDARAALDRVPAAAVRRAFRPRLRAGPLLAALPCAVLAGALLRVEPWRPGSAPPKDPAVAYREAKEKEDAAKAARRVLEAAKRIEETADPKKAALVAAAAEVRRQAEEMLRRQPPKAEAMAGFQRMGELVRERQELLAGVEPGKLQEWRADGRLSKLDPDLEKLLGKLLDANLKDMQSRLRSLDGALKAKAGGEAWTRESLQSLKEQIEALADALEKDAALSDRPGMKKGLGSMGDPELLRRVAEKMSKLMETLKEQGWEGCQKYGGLDPEDDGSSDFEDAEGFSDEQLQAMLQRLEEMQRLADLGELAFCQNCNMTGGT